MKYIKIKETYLLMLILVGLISLSLYTTYALFTASSEIENVVDFTANLTSDSSIKEYEMVTIPAGETKIVEMNIINSYTTALYYGAWYEMVVPKEKNNQIDIGIYSEKNDTPGSGTISQGETKNLLVGIKNNTNSDIIVNIGVASNKESNLNLTETRNIITENWNEIIFVTEEVLEQYKIAGSENSVDLKYTNVGKYEVTLEPGSYMFETWGAQGGSYNETYTGGKGGYSYGTINLTTATQAIVYVGGQGTCSYSSNANYAYNGGGAYGDGGGTSNGGMDGCSGGGGSDIRLGQDSLYARVIVAGGGGGAGGAGNVGGAGTENVESATIGGSGGGTSGINGNVSRTTSNATRTEGGSGGMAGTQTNGGNGGRRGESVTADQTDGTYYTGGGGGGGGGWYGGGGGGGGSTTEDTGLSGNAGSFGIGGAGGDGTSSDAYFSGGGGSGAGGSGYVYTTETASNYPSGCLLNSSHYLLSAATIAGNEEFTDLNGSMVAGHSGNGAVRILGLVSYSIPRVVWYNDLIIEKGNNSDVTSDIKIICASGETGCSLVSTSISDTSNLETGTHKLYYVIQDSKGNKYKYERNLIISEKYEYTTPGMIELPLSAGTYLLEVWGAQGGNYNTTYVGGKGGYSYGTLTLTSTTTAYIYVGGQASTYSTTTGSNAGGFNGGGNGYTNISSGLFSTKVYGLGGGGASDIRLGQDNSYARVIVAGGGSGSSFSDSSLGSDKGNNGYYGGGVTSGGATTDMQATSTKAGTNGSFGNGASTTSGNGTGGGGGWYGGGITGGGSGYVYTSETASNYPSGCLLNSSHYLTNAGTIDGNQSFVDYDGSTVMGHSGNGAVRITKIG